MLLCSPSADLEITGFCAAAFNRRSRLFVFVCLALLGELGTSERKSCTSNGACQDEQISYQHTGPGCSCNLQFCDYTPRGNVVKFKQAEFRTFFDQHCLSGCSNESILAILSRGEVTLMDVQLGPDEEGYMKCPAGFTCHARNTWPPIPCPVGHFALEGQDVCQACSIGHYAGTIAQQQCTPCQAGSFQSEMGKSECRRCGEYECRVSFHGEFVKGNGCFMPSEGGHSCTCVSSGHVPSEDHSQAIQCPPGKHQKLPCQVTCDDCAPGMYTPQNGSVSCICNKLGHYVLDGGVGMASCAAGMHQDENCSAAPCKRCVSGKWSHRGAEHCLCAPKGAQTTAQQDGYEYCPPGFYSPGCIPHCLKCEPGRVARNSASTVCDCAPAGYRSNADNTASVPCSPGTYADEPCLPLCKKCQPGAFSEHAGAHNCSCASKGHSVNREQTHQVECGLGYYAPVICSESCLACPRGRYSNDTVSSQCEHCVHGYAQSKEGRTSCYKCGRGTYSDDNALEECKACPWASYSLGEGPNDECMPCLAPLAYFGIAHPDQCFVLPGMVLLGGLWLFALASIKGWRCAAFMCEPCRRIWNACQARRWAVTALQAGRPRSQAGSEMPEHPPAPQGLQFPDFPEHPFSRVVAGDLRTSARTPLATP